MAVVPHDVRVALNGIPEDEVSDDLILQKISDAELDATDLGFPDNTRYIRALAAFRSFRASNAYLSARVGDVSVRRDIEEYLKGLWQEVITALETGGYERIQVVSTPMFDDRPEDPNETQTLD